MATTTTTTQNPLWDLQAQYLPESFRQAEQIYFQGAPQYYPGQTVAGFDPVRAEGINRGLQAAAGPQQQLADAYSQGILGIAQGTDPATQRLASQAGAAVNQAASGAGVLGGSRAQRAGQTAAADVIAGRQLQALSQIPQAQQAALAPAQTYGAAGRTQQDYQQSLIDADRDRYSYQSNLPFNWLRQYQQGLGFPGSTSAPTTSTVQNQPSGLETATGLLSLASGVGGLFGIFAEGGEVPGSFNWVPYAHQIDYNQGTNQYRVGDQLFNDPTSAYYATEFSQNEQAAGRETPREIAARTPGAQDVYQEPTPGSSYSWDYSQGVPQLAPAGSTFAESLPGWRGQQSYATNVGQYTPTRIGPGADVVAQQQAAAHQAQQDREDRMWAQYLASQRSDVGETPVGHQRSTADILRDENATWAEKAEALAQPTVKNTSWGDQFTTGPGGAISAALPGGLGALALAGGELSRRNLENIHDKALAEHAPTGETNPDYLREAFGGGAVDLTGTPDSTNRFFAPGSLPTVATRGNEAGTVTTPIAISEGIIPGTRVVSGNTDLLPPQTDANRDGIVSAREIDALADPNSAVAKEVARVNANKATANAELARRNQEREDNNQPPQQGRAVTDRHGNAVRDSSGGIVTDRPTQYGGSDNDSGGSSGGK